MLLLFLFSHRIMYRCWDAAVYSSRCLQLFGYCYIVRTFVSRMEAFLRVCYNKYSLYSVHRIGCWCTKMLFLQHLSFDRPTREKKNEKREAVTEGRKKPVECTVYSVHIIVDRSIKIHSVYNDA